MDTSQHLSNDSFSYSWLMNAKPPLDSAGNSLRLSLDAQDGSSFIEMDPKLFSKRWKSPTTGSRDFDFHLPSPQSPALVHADQIISDGLLLPLHLVRPPKAEAITDSPPVADSALPRSLSIDSSKSLLSRSNRFQSPRRLPMSSNSSPVCGPLQGFITSSSSGSSKSDQFARSTKQSARSKFLRKYLCFLLPFSKKVKGLVLVRKAKLSAMSSAANCMESMRSSPPRPSDAFSSCESHRGKAVVDAGTETAIHDAVLHCKNSFGKS